MSRDLKNEQTLAVALRKIMRAVDLHSRQLVGGFGLTGPQLATLQQAAYSGPTSPTLIARAIHLSLATVTGVLHRLEVRGLISRHRSDTDRRSIVVSVTPAGEELLKAAPSPLQDRFRQELRGLADWEQMLIVSTIQRVANMMGGEDLEAEAGLDRPVDDLKNGTVIDPLPDPTGLESPITSEPGNDMPLA